MPRETGQVFKALLQQQESIILDIADMNEGCYMWNHLGINSFVGMAMEFLPLCLLIVQKDLHWGTGDGFSL